MGPLLHHESTFQNLLQAQFNKLVEKHTSSFECIENRHAYPGGFPKISYRNLQVLCWCNFLSRGRLQAGTFPTPPNWQFIPTNTEEAEESLTEAYKLCHASSYRNKEYVFWHFQTFPIQLNMKSSRRL